MRLPDNLPDREELLHRVMQLMLNQSASPHPFCYAVWYEYAAGNNPALNAAVDALQARSVVLDDQATYALYRQYVVGDVKEMSGRDVSLISYLEESQREVEKLRGEIRQAREDALADGLTGLLNRRGFDLAFENCLAVQDHAEGPSLLIADIDSFKRINDSFGHIFGDRVIRGIARILRDNVKGKDIAARYGGEEFIVLLPDTSLRGARFLAENIRAAVANCHFRRVDDSAAHERITISIGVTRYRTGESPTSFIERADGALYASKANGRNRVTVAEVMAAG